jgi:hypothetical protein
MTPGHFSIILVERGRYPCSVIVADELLDLGAGVGLDQAQGYFTDDFVALIAPGPSISRSASHGHDDCEHNNSRPLHHARYVHKIKVERLSPLKVVHAGQADTLSAIFRRRMQ